MKTVKLEYFVIKVLQLTEYSNRASIPLLKSTLVLRIKAKRTNSDNFIKCMHYMLLENCKQVFSTGRTHRKLFRSLLTLMKTDLQH